MVSFKDGSTYASNYTLEVEAVLNLHFTISRESSVLIPDHRLAWLLPPRLSSQHLVGNPDINVPIRKVLDFIQRGPDSNFCNWYERLYHPITFL
ncbi:hypothetical protein WG66_009357 [Moniliophthora roreri]|nr:hypothetical protein WG66_009357 [Moniliophthora roreri]